MSIECKHPRRIIQHRDDITIKETLLKVLNGTQKRAVWVQADNNQYRRMVLRPGLG